MEERREKKTKNDKGGCGCVEDVLDLAWSPHDVWLASCSVDNTVVVWNALKFPGEQPLSGKDVMCLAKVMVVVYYNTVVVWNALRFPGEQPLSGKDVMCLAKVMVVVYYNTVVVWNALKFIGEQALRVSGKDVMRLAKVTVVVWNALKFPGEQPLSGKDVMCLAKVMVMGYTDLFTLHILCRKLHI